MERRYPVLRVVSSLIRILAFVGFLGGIASLIAVLSNQSDLSSSNKVGYYIGGILGVAIYSAFIYAIGDDLGVP